MSSQPNELLAGRNNLVVSSYQRNEEERSDDSEIAAATALTSLVKTTSTDSTSTGDVEDFDIPQRMTKSGRIRAVPFPVKLMKALSRKENQHILCWTPSGKAFHIIKPKAFATEVLPIFFKTSKYSSFTRKLHRWGFSRHFRGEDSGAYYHELFQRGRLDLAEKMACSTKEDISEPTTKKPLKVNPIQAKPLTTVPTGSDSSVMQSGESVSLNSLSPENFNLTDRMQGASLYVDPLYRQQLEMAVQEPTISQLDAAIESEVRRRIEMALIQRHLAMRLGPGTSMDHTARRLLLQRVLLGSTLPLDHHQQIKIKSSDQSPSFGLNGLPPTNIQSAKTA